MYDTIVVKIPSRDWAMCAIDDLATEGLTAELLDTLDAEGVYQLRITGPFETIDVIRQELHVPQTRVCWETFVNAAIAG
ncbi:MAG TPA: hypothetical protein VGR61_03920 [Candidatus Dormibacteraeota bacterium]|nr:hypothetical protein [Candidatus Dormibacteraeota bacterium]